MTGRSFWLTVAVCGFIACFGLGTWFIRASMYGISFSMKCALAMAIVGLLYAMSKLLKFIVATVKDIFQNPFSN
jgi:hypothetical protein